MAEKDDAQKKLEQAKLEADARAGSRKAQEELGWKGQKTEKVADQGEKERLEAEAKAAEEQQKAAEKAAEEQRKAAEEQRKAAEKQQQQQK